MKIALESFQYLSNDEHKKIIKNKKNISLTFVCFKLCFLFVSFIFFSFCIVQPGTETMGGSITWRKWEGIRQAHIHIQ